MQDLDLIPGIMQFTNLAGGGGGVAFAEVVNKRNDADDLIVAASTATATRLAQGAYPGNSMDQVRWIGTVGANYGLIAVAADSEIDQLTALLEQIKNDPRSVSIAGGSAVGGWDHLKVLLAANAAGIGDLRTIKSSRSMAAVRLSHNFWPAPSRPSPATSRGQGFRRLRAHQGHCRTLSRTARRRTSILSHARGTGHRRDRRQLARLLRTGRYER